MNKFILIAFTLFTLNVFSTHNRAGEILYKRVPPFTSVVGTVTTQVYTYSITLIRYTDHGQGIADRCTDTISFGDGQKVQVPRSNGTNTCGCSPGLCGEIIINESNYVVKKNIYSVVHTYSGPGVYIVSVLDPNRNQGVINIPNSVNHPFYIESVIVINSTTGINSSPLLTNPPVDKGILGSCYYHHPGAYDAEGDSLSYHLTPCLSGQNQPVSGFTYPSGVFNISPSTGLITWCNPQLIGEYNFAFVIKEWKKTGCSGAYQFAGSVMRDMQTLIYNPNTYSLTISSLPDTCMVAGSILSQSLQILTNNSSTLSLLGAFSATPNSTNASITPTLAATNFTSAFSYSANCSMMNHEPHQIIFAVHNNSNLWAYKYSTFSLKIVPPAPLIHSVTVDTGIVKLKWKKVNACPGYITGYNIYRKPSVNSWSRSACESGVPAYTGFYLVGSTSVQDTTFNDINFWAINNGMVGNYIVTAVSNNCSESFADTIKTINYVVGIKERKDRQLNAEIFPNPTEDNLQIELNELVSSEISITSIEGKLLEKKTFFENRISMSIARLSVGIYFLNIKTEKGIVTHKIIRK